MTIYMKEGVEVHIHGALRTDETFEPNSNFKDKPVLTADIRQADGMIYIYQRQKDDSRINRMALNKENVLFIDFENESEAEKRPMVSVRRRESSY